MSPAGAGLTTARTKSKGTSATPLLLLRAPLLNFLAADVGAHLEGATQDSGVQTKIHTVCMLLQNWWLSRMVRASGAVLPRAAGRAARSFVTKRRWWRDGLEMLLVGFLAAAVAYGVGAARPDHRRPGVTSAR
jgi:hypothetical protein